MSMTTAATRKLTIIAQDPMVKNQDGRILTTQVSIPAEELALGPWGYRVQVIDYDASAKTLYSRKRTGEAAAKTPSEDALGREAVERSRVSCTKCLRDRDENTRSVRVRPGPSSRLGVQAAPVEGRAHAFADANAFYSREHEALLFGYFPGREGKTIFSCLSHDVVAHETTHALVDGLRSGYLDPSSADQAAFHEGISDVVALLSVFALDDVVRAVLDRHAGDLPQSGRDRTSWMWRS